MLPGKRYRVPVNWLLADEFGREREKRYSSLRRRLSRSRRRESPAGGQVVAKLGSAPSPHRYPNFRNLWPSSVWEENITIKRTA